MQNNCYCVCGKTVIWQERWQHGQYVTLCQLYSSQRCLQSPRHCEEAHYLAPVQDVTYFVHCLPPHGKYELSTLVDHSTKQTPLGHVAQQQQQRRRRRRGRRRRWASSTYDILQENTTCLPSSPRVFVIHCLFTVSFLTSAYSCNFSILKNLIWKYRTGSDICLEVQWNITS